MRKKKIKVPAAAMGLNTGLIGKLGGMKFDPSSANITGAMQGVGSLATMFGTSDATSGGEATVQSLAGIAQGAGAGAQIGSMFGPAGTIIGGAAGAVTGLIGKKGKSAEMTSFTDYDEGSLATGLRGAFRNKKLRRRRNHIKTNAYGNRAAVAGTENLAEDWAAENYGLDTNTFEDGGRVPTSLAYVDDGELIQTPDGSVQQVPEMGQPTDSNLVSLPEGSKVLSNTLKVPGTKKTFSEIGEEMMTKKKSKNKDRFAENAAMLNEKNNKYIHDALFDMQEQVKAIKGVKGKTKDAPTLAYGGWDPLKDNWYTGGSKRANYADNTWWHLPMGSTATTKQVSRFVMPTSSNKPTRRGKSTSLPEDYVESTSPSVPRLTSSRSTSNLSLPIDSSLTQAPAEYQSDTNGTDINELNNLWNRKYKRDSALSSIGNGLTSIASLAPILSNMFTKPEYVNANYNPYANATRNAMARRRFNINPALQDIDRNRRISNYNAEQMNTGTGANLAYRLQTAVNSDRQTAALRAQENNANNQYIGEYANTLNNLGQQWVSATNLASETNAANRAKARQFRRQGTHDLSQWFIDNQTRANQANRDYAMLDLYKPFLQSGFSTNLLNDVYNRFKR